MIKRYTHEIVEKIWSEENKFKTWLDIEIAICAAMEELKVIPEGVANNIRDKAKINIKRIQELEEITKHEVVGFVNSIIEQIGKNGSYFHYGVTSSDIMDTSFSILLRDSLNVIINELDSLISVVKQKAILYKNLPCIGRTHGVHAEVMSFGLKFLSYYEELLRDKRRLEDVRENISVCIISGAVGTYTSIDPKIENIVAKELGLKTIGVTTQVVPRDIYAECFNALSLLAGGVERIAVELRHLQRTEVMELREEFSKGQTGSSAMPHKKNPISAENLTGCARLIRAYTGSSLENIALWHERDISHSSVERVIGPDATILSAYMLKRLKNIISKLNVDEDKVKENMNITRGLVYSSTLLVALMNKGLKRDDAYKIVQDLSMDFWDKLKEKNDLFFIDIVKNSKEIKKYLNSSEIDSVFDIKHALRHTDLIYKKVLEG